MSRKCEMCGKGALYGNNVSHSNIKTKKKSFPNLQKVRALVDGTVKRIQVCTRCIRTGKIEKSL